jgi:BirA family biotin operon repressor/biotin-[acetyl-CoA-carboxylase] ligase
MLDDAQIETALRSRSRFQLLQHVASCRSTQELAAASPRDASGTFVEGVFWADHQSHGRGRQQREWHDEPGADLAVTFRVRQPLPEPLALPAALPVVVAEACASHLARAPRIKWPNDLLVDGRKLSGVLVDAGGLGPDTYLIGIGINCNRTCFPADLEATATSLALAAGHTVDRGRLLVEVAVLLDRALEAMATGATEGLLRSYRTGLGLLGQRVRVGIAAAAGVDSVQEGVLTAIDFTTLELDGGRRLALGMVRSLR